MNLSEAAPTVLGWFGLILALFFTVIMAGPSLRGTLRWGRFGHGPRASSLTAAAWILVFVSLAITGFLHLHTPLLFFLSFGLFLFSAVRDHLKGTAASEGKRGR